MTLEQFASVVGGLVCTLVGISAIVRRKIQIGDGDQEEPTLWLYGWRASVVGAIALAVAVLFFASAAGVVHLE